MIETISPALWEETRSLRPIVEQAQAEADSLRRLPDAVARAFVVRDVYRLLLPQDLGGRGLSPLCVFDLIEEVASYDGSVGWNYAIGSNSGSMAGVMLPDISRFAGLGEEDKIGCAGTIDGYIRGALAQ